MAIDLNELAAALGQMTLRFCVRRRTSAVWTSINEVLLLGEIGLETNTGKFKFGDGSTAWNSLAYSSGGSGSSGVVSVVGGPGIAVDSTDPYNPIVSASSIVHPKLPTALSGQSVSLVDDLRSGLGAAWTIVNSGATGVLSYTSTVDGLLANINSPASQRRCNALRSLGTMNVGDAYAVRVRFCSSNTNQYMLCGVALTDGVTSGSGVQLYSEICFQHGSQLRVGAGTDLCSSFTTRTTWVGDTFRLWSNEFWVRIVKTASTTYRTDTSEDGRIWVTANSITNSTAFTYCGITLAGDTNATVGANMLVSDFCKMTGVS